MEIPHQVKVPCIAQPLKGPLTFTYISWTCSDSSENHWDRHRSCKDRNKDRHPHYRLGGWDGARLSGSKLYSRSSGLALLRGQTGKFSEGLGSQWDLATNELYIPDQKITSLFWVSVSRSMKWGELGWMVFTVFAGFNSLRIFSQLFAPCPSQSLTSFDFALSSPHPEL